MSLLQHIKNDRAERKIKEPFKQTLFNIVGSLVKTCDLDDGFLEEMDHFSEDFPEEHLETHPLEVKPPKHHSLFPLLTEDQYRVTSNIIESVNNPYLYFANSPEEILFSRILFSHNSGIEEKKLMRCHFKTLFSFELANKKARNLVRQINQIRKKEDKISSGEQKRVSVLTTQLKKLEAFISDVETAWAET